MPYGLTIFSAFVRRIAVRSRTRHINYVLSPLLRDRADQIRALCERFDVETLEVFGSVTDPRFDLASSDLDLIVRFVHEQPEGYADRFLGLAESLEELFGRRVDLLTERSIRNPYFRKAVDASRIKIYERETCSISFPMIPHA